MNFQKIGSGWNKKNLKGTRYVSISLDPTLINRMVPEDFRKICMFENSFKKKPESPDWSIMAPVDDQERANPLSNDVKEDQSVLEAEASRF